MATWDTNQLYDTFLHWLPASRARLLLVAIDLQIETVLVVRNLHHVVPTVLSLPAVLLPILATMAGCFGCFRIAGFPVLYS